MVTDNSQSLVIHKLSNFVLQCIRAKNVNFHEVHFSGTPLTHINKDVKALTVFYNMGKNL